MTAILQQSNWEKIKHELYFSLGCHQITFIPMMLSKRKTRTKIVSDKTEIVIDGFPRSANTFADVAFRFAQKREVNMAHHLHAPAQVLMAVKRNVPTIVLIRDPRDAVVSLSIRHPDISLTRSLKHYKRYYQTIYPHHSKYVVATFNQVTTNFGQVIAKVNAQFGTSFNFFEHNPENIDACFATIERRDQLSQQQAFVDENKVSRPSAGREAIKKRLQNELDQPSHQQTLAEAQDLFAKFNRLAE